jgi:hypothetical protein
VADEERSRPARRAAERALIRVVHHYGARPEFVVLGGLVPDLLCSASNQLHAGTTDVDVQVDMEIACGAVNTRRLEDALRNAEFEPDGEREWRWVTDGPGPKSVVEFELLADLDDQPAQVTISFDGCERLGAVNLRGTGFATRDHEVRILRTFNAGQHSMTSPPTSPTPTAKDLKHSSSKRSSTTPTATRGSWPLTPFSPCSASNELSPRADEPTFWTAERA